MAFSAQDSFHFDGEGNFIGFIQLNPPHHFIAVEADSHHGPTWGALGGLVTVLEQAYQSDKLKFFARLDLELVIQCFCLLIEAASKRKHNQYLIELAYSLENSLWSKYFGLK